MRLMMMLVGAVVGDVLISPKHPKMVIQLIQQMLTECLAISLFMCTKMLLKI